MAVSDDVKSAVGALKQAMVKRIDAVKEEMQELKRRLSQQDTT